MKYAVCKIPPKAYLKVMVKQATRRVFFDDVKAYARVPKRSTPPIPKFSRSRSCKQTEEHAETDGEQSIISISSSPLEAK
jgi:hypothetical protein